MEGLKMAPEPQDLDALIYKNLKFNLSVRIGIKRRFLSKGRYFW